MQPLTCSRCQSTVIVGLTDMGGTTPDLQPACRAHVGLSPSIDEMVASLTDSQKRVIELAVDQRSTHSGRGGQNIQVMRALERKGFVRQGKIDTDTQWSFTPSGRVLGEHLHLKRVEKSCREKPTSELIAWFPDARGQSCGAIMRELEARGWQWQATSTDWVRIHTPEWTVVEGVAGTYSYHLRDVSQQSLRAACDAMVMTTRLPLSSWGIKDHLPSRWCQTCAARAELL